MMTPAHARLRGVVLGALAACGGPGDPPGSCAIDPMGAGDGTYYAADGTGNCSFDPPGGSPLLVAAMNDADYGQADYCGACLDVTGPAGHVVVRVVDRCPECATGDLDLSPDAFAALAELSAGRVPVTWTEVPCDVSGPIRYRFKEGSNPDWTAIQIRNHRYPIAALEARDAGGAWHPIARERYNYFVAPAGLGAGPYALRVTDDRGHVVEDLAVPFAEASEVAGGAQLGTCP